MSRCPLHRHKKIQFHFYVVTPMRIIFCLTVVIHVGVDHRGRWWHLLLYWEIRWHLLWCRRIWRLLCPCPPTGCTGGSGTCGGCPRGT